jgi:hypothetical protein
MSEICVIINLDNKKWHGMGFSIYGLIVDIYDILKSFIDEELVGELIEEFNNR